MSAAAAEAEKTLCVSCIAGTQTDAEMHPEADAKEIQSNLADAGYVVFRVPPQQAQSGHIVAYRLDLGQAWRLFTEHAQLGRLHSNGARDFRTAVTVFHPSAAGTPACFVFQHLIGDETFRGRIEQNLEKMGLGLRVRYLERDVSGFSPVNVTVLNPESLRALAEAINDEKEFPLGRVRALFSSRAEDVQGSHGLVYRLALGQDVDGSLPDGRTASDIVDAWMRNCRRHICHGLSERPET